MVKIELPMPYYDTEQAVGHLDMTTGDCVFFHQNGKMRKKYSSIKYFLRVLMDTFYIY